MGTFISRTVLLLALPVVPAVLVGWLHPEAPPLTAPALAEGEIELREALDFDQVLWVDARATEAFAAGHIEGALNLNEDVWHDQVGEVLMAWQPGVPVIVYCDSRTCDASHAVAARLRGEMSLESVYALHGGWEVWQANHTRMKSEAPK